MQIHITIGTPGGRIFDRASILGHALAIAPPLIHSSLVYMGEMYCMGCFVVALHFIPGLSREQFIRNPHVQGVH